MSLSDDQIDLLDQSKEVRVETSSERRTHKTIIWIVVANGNVYVRSVRGENGRWYRRTLADPRVIIHIDGERMEFRAEPVDDPEEIETVSEALRDKYPPGGSLDRMTRTEVLDTTLRLEPIS